MMGDKSRIARDGQTAGLTAILMLRLFLSVFILVVGLFLSVFILVVGLFGSSEP
jgi:hypothetical protein